jgi:hypothetical protein
MSIEDLQEIVVELPIGDVTCGLARRQAAEIGKPPLLTNEKTHHVQALVLSAVLRTTSLSYGNMPFSGTHPTKTPRPIVLKLFTVDYIGETTKCAKNGYNRLARGGSPYK